ncbi:3-oxoacyl-[acyl-carrier-protein] reductase isoform X3 [Physeter macrocephalus]|uniref:3-ketoacyl-[acyl-carrier-protein] reductase beta subunit n=1 Tax=Physeter macrocephalus TaxID=9755 RepID=A0A455BQH0_PHYMC|nr:3-oxoacyl-[acyl-carrier-protein] reductase isoform X3 [Physeter catodon]|eukprot:XP_028350078.1 carbonyl reductase family member 4 isoform X3 [Physeter catodon]
MDRVCAVFGGSRGIGRAVARLMAQRGYRLAIVARNLQGARAAAGDLGGDHLALSCDVAKEHDVQNTFEEIEKNLGRVNFLVNAAGINRDNLLVRTNAEDMLSQLHTNLLGSMLTCRAAVKTMIKQQAGSIVNVGSVAGVKGSSGQSVYSASKGGLVAFSRSLAKEVARKKIRVNVVAPAGAEVQDSLKATRPEPSSDLPGAPEVHPPLFRTVPTASTPGLRCVTSVF